MKEYIDKMLQDTELTREEKIVLLIGWLGSLRLTLETTILHSSEVINMNNLIAHMEENKKSLQL